MTETFSVKDFEKYQHYRDRAPPWIKFYNELLDDYEFGRLPDTAKAHLMAIWLLASRSDNCMPLDGEWVARRINATTTVDLEALRQAGFLEVPARASKPLATRKRGACAEREGETEEETETETEQSPPAAGKTDSADDFLEEERKKKKAKPIREDFPEGFEAFWRDYPVEPIMSKTRAYGQWAALSEKDRAAAHAALAPFRALCLRDPSYRVLHAERFLSQRRFDGFVDPHRGAAQIETEAARSRWGGAAAALVDEIGAPAFMAYFGEAAFDPGPPVRVAIAKAHLRDRAREKYSAVLRRLFGEFTLEATTTSPVSWPGNAERQRSGTGHPGDANANASEPGTNISSTSRAQAGTP